MLLLAVIRTGGAVFLIWLVPVTKTGDVIAVTWIGLVPDTGSVVVATSLVPDMKRSLLHSSL